MTNVLIIIHLFVTIALIGIVLIQRSEGGGLGIGSSQGMGGLMSGRGTANLLTRTTAILATLFLGLALVLALLNRGAGNTGRGLLDLAPTPAATAIPGPPAKSTLPPARPIPMQATPATPATTPAPAANPAPPAGDAPAPGAPAKPAAPPVPTN